MFAPQMSSMQKFSVRLHLRSDAVCAHSVDEIYISLNVSTLIPPSRLVNLKNVAIIVTRLSRSCIPSECNQHGRFSPNRNSKSSTNTRLCNDMYSQSALDKNLCPRVQ
jgi:hypothetical protein